VASVREAQSLLATHRPDLILLDIRSRGGLHFLTRLAGRLCRPAVVVYSVDAARLDSLPSWLADACVLKSSNLGALTGAIRRVIPRRHLCPAPSCQAAVDTPTTRGPIEDTNRRRGSAMAPQHRQRRRIAAGSAPAVPGRLLHSR